MRTVKKGATSQSIYFDVLDSTSTTGGRKTGLAYNTSSLVAYYVRNGDVATAITLATLAAANTAWSSGGFKEVDAANMPGIYRLDVPDAAFATGADSVAIVIKGATGMVQASVDMQLVAYDPQDSVRAGLTALPNAAAEAAGGLYTRGTGAGQINQDANGRVDANAKAWAGTATMLTSGLPDVNMKTITAGIIAAASFASGALDAVWSTTTRLLTAGTNIVLAKGTGVTGLNDLSAAQVNAEADTALADAGVTSVRQAHLDADISSRSTYDGSDTAGTATLLSRLGAPVGASISADIAAVKAVDDAVKAKTDNLPSDPADASVIAAAFTALEIHGDGVWATATGFSTLDAAGVNAEVDAALADAGVTTVRMAHLDADVSTRMAGDDYTAPDNAGIASVDGKATTILAGVVAIDSKTTNLPSDPADQSLVIAATNGILSAVAALNNLSAAEVNAEVDQAITDAALATAASLAATDGKVDAVQDKTDQLAFTGDGVSADMRSINGATLIGDGSVGDKFGPA